MPPQRSTEFVALMAKLHPRATTSAALMPQKTSLNSGGLVEINAVQYCFIAQINSDDQHRARFIPVQEVLEEPSGHPRKMQPIIQEMILGRKRGVMLIPESEDDAVDVIAGLIEQGFHDLASEYRDFIIGQLEKSKAKAGS